MQHFVPCLWLVKWSNEYLHYVLQKKNMNLCLSSTKVKMFTEISTFAPKI